ncbi:MAG: hypothetical protein RH917_00870 [Lacipirellulaceae bacterium]
MIKGDLELPMTDQRFSKPAKTCLLLGVAILTLTVSNNCHASITVLDQDTVIDANNSFSDSAVEIINGPQGPPLVQLLDGGVIGVDGLLQRPGRRFTGGSTVVRDDAHLLIDGGRTEFFVDLTDNARLTVLNGSIGCTAECETSSYTVMLYATGQSVMHLYGGDFRYYSISLAEQSVAHLYGPELQVISGSLSGTNPRSVVVEGLLLNGQKSEPLRFILQDQSDLVLHIVPEPSTAVISFFVLLSVGYFASRSTPTFSSKNPNHCSFVFGVPRM